MKPAAHDRSLLYDEPNDGMHCQKVVKVQKTCDTFHVQHLGHMNMARDDTYAEQWTYSMSCGMATPQLTMASPKK